QLIESIRSASPTQLRKLVPRTPYDLQTIVEKSMAPQPSRRYQTAAEMADDLQRFLDGQPVLARRVTAAERLWLWAKKERALATSLAAVFLLLVTAALGSIFAAQQQAQLASEKAAETKAATKQRNEAWQNAYFADIRQAYQDWENGQTRRMLTTLRAYLPVEGSPDVRGWEWYYLLHLAHNNVTTLTDFDGVATQVAWTPNDQRLVSTHSDGSLRFWDRSGKPLLKIPIPGLAQFSINQAGDRVVTASADSLLRFWDVETGKLVHTLKTDFSELQAVDWHEGTQRLAIAGKRIAVVEDQPDQLVGGSAVISARDGDVVWRQDAYPFHIKFSPDGSRVVELSGGKFRVVELNGPPRETAIVPFRDFQPKCMSWLPDNRRFVIGCFLHPSCLMEVGDEGVKQIGRFSEQTIDAVAVSRDGERIFAGNRGQRIDLIEVTDTDFKRLKSLRGHLGPPISVAIDSQEKLLASTSQDGSIKIWDLSEPEKAVEPVSFGQSPDGRWRWHTEGSFEVAITDTLDREAKKIVFARGNPVEVKAKFFPNVSRALFWDVSWAGCPYRVAIFDTDAGRIVDYWLAHNARPPWASVSGDFATMTTGDGGILFFDGRTGHIRSIALHAGSDLACAGLSPDGKKIASCLNGEIKVWDAATTTEEATMFGQRPGGFMPWLCWGNTNRFFATASVDRTIVIWDAYEKRAHQTLHGLQGMPQLRQFGFLMDDRRFTARDGENQKVWDVGTGREILSVPNGTEAVQLFERSTSVREIRDWCLRPGELQFNALRKAESVANNQTAADAYARDATHLMARKVLDASNCYFSPERALKLSTQALDRNPTSADCLWTHCVAQYRNGLYVAALATLRMANDSGFDSVTADFVRADCLNKTGERDESRRVLAAAEQRLTRTSDIQSADLFLIRDVVVSYFDQERNQRDAKKIVVVNTLRDELDASNQETSLREAVRLAAEGAEITIRVTGTIALRYGPIRVDKSMTIAGPGKEKLTISGQDKTQIFEIDDHVPSNDSPVTLRGLRCTEGRCADMRSVGTGWGGSGTGWGAHGGGAIFSTESLLVEDCEFRRNTSEFGGGAVSSDGGLESTYRRCSFSENSAKVGGAVHLHTQKARVENCTFEANQTFSLSSAVNHCGNSMVIVNSTFADNVDRSSTSAWGAVLAHTSKASIDHCTFTRNMGGAIVMTYHPTYWARLEVGKDFAGPNLTVTNSILFGNMDRNNSSLDLQKDKGLTCTFRDCIIGTLPAGMVSTDDNLLGVDPKLGPLKDNGGPTKTIGLLPGSPAIDAADSQIEFDQRGQARVGAPDIGAVEFSQAK
ncbi:MAG: right-handed parallel beta-helix repeat-containing protein, partial [Planctomycetales bacterium]|nr:right-handed parallel beta-helix repeat-containing protein [Planctomycetales bacterium]